MEYIELLEAVGLPGAALILAALAGRVLWSFFTSTIYPNMRADRREANEQRRIELENDRQQQIWMVEQFRDVSANMQRLLDQQRALEDACWNRTLAEWHEKNPPSAYETQPIPVEDVRKAQAQEAKNGEAQ